MLFNSVQFLILFFPITFALFSWAKKRSPEASMVVLLIASLVFYSWWDWRFTPMLIASIVINYYFGRHLAVHRTGLQLGIGISLNLIPLLIFKYAGWVAGMVGTPIQTLVLPLGISFFTFLQIGYLTSIYRNTNEHRGFLPYSVFVTYFPHLIAGPILKHNEVTQQLVSIPRGPIEFGEKFARGTLLLVVGLFKKVIIADAFCSGFANSIFAEAATANFVEAWTGALAYSAQLYFDFSGYCEMALGMSLMLGITIPINFASPYRSTDIAQFWRTWHMSLSGFFREHIYIPLGGNRHGFVLSVVALSITFFLTGLWHGAGWTFVLWGCLHAFYLILFRLWTKTGVSLPIPIAKTVTIVAVIFAWVLFRAASLSDCIAMWASMIGLNGITIGAGFMQFREYIPAGIAFADSHLVVGTEVLLYGVLLGWCATAKNVHEFELKPTIRHASMIGVMAITAMLFINRQSSFLYWQF
ncbi:MBOAT family O-acyltransferase [Ottowia sp.]|uniref:MBOAT family O-acyltransferase n=1 Tax=Ottowia sp. TaxID=1898956 RepID=UPI0025E4E300|nr:MBOAT family O-acyltransferase [Ottowia sp.]MBK6616711.1 MBOAT family protein [Ottowia sp.]